MTACPSCGHENAETNKFCGECAAPLGAPTRPVAEEADLKADVALGNLPYHPDNSGVDREWPPETDPELEQAIRENRASFAQYANTWFFSDPEFNDHGDVSLRRYQSYYERIYKAFTAAEGRVVDSYFCAHVPTAAALTARCRRLFPSLRPEELTIHIVDNPPREGKIDWQSGAALGIISSCNDLASKAQEFLAGRWRRVCVDQLYGIVTDALSILDRGGDAGDVKPVPGAEGSGLTHPFSLVNQARDGLKSIQEYFTWAAERLAVLRFLRGVLLSALTVPLVAWILSLAVGKDAEAALWAMAAGAVGATASVLNRVTKDRLRLDYEAGTARLHILGAVRPVLGGISGLVLYFAVEGGILPLNPGVEFSRFALLTVLSFAAGFSERFAEDMLAYVGARTGVGGGEQPNSADKAPRPTSSRNGKEHPSARRGNRKMRGRRRVARDASHPRTHD